MRELSLINTLLGDTSHVQRPMVVYVGRACSRDVYILLYMLHTVLIFALHDINSLLVLLHMLTGQGVD